MDTKNALLLRSALIAESHADFNMTTIMEKPLGSVFFQNNDIFNSRNQIDRCGTIACIKGTAQLLESELTSTTYAKTNAIKWLNLKYDQSRLLFFGISKDKNGGSFREFDLREIMLPHAIASLDSMMLTGTCDWEIILATPMTELEQAMLTQPSL